jgi:hypothetical protein
MHAAAFRPARPVGTILVTLGLLASVLIAPSAGAAPVDCPTGSMPFRDVPTSSYAYDDVICIERLGVTTGTSATTYSPDDYVTREQMAAFLARLHRVIGGSAAPVVSVPFTDVPTDSFARDDIARIYGLGITTGTTATTYAPDDYVTREQMAAFLARLRRSLEGFCASPATPFTDVPDTSFAELDVACLYGLGITTGTTATTYSPDDYVTREQMASFLARFYRAGRRDATFTPTPPNPGPVDPTDPTDPGGPGGPGGPGDRPCALRTEYTDVNEVVVSDRLAVWWGPDGGDLTTVADLVTQDMEAALTVATETLGFDPPMGSPTFCSNVYLIDTGGVTDTLRAGFGQDVNGVPYVNLPIDIASEFLTTPPGPNSQSHYTVHELMHVLQVGASFPNDGDAAWYWEATAEWFVDRMFPTDTLGKETIGQYLLNPQLPLWAAAENQGVPAGDLSPSRRFHSFGAQAFLTWLSDQKGATRTIVDSWSDAPTGTLPQEWLFDELAADGTNMASTFVDFAARAATVDFPRNADAIAAHRATAAAASANAGDVNFRTATVPAAGVGWKAAPAALRPGAWAYNAIQLTADAAATYLVEIDPAATGSAGTPSDLRGVLVRRRGDTRTYTALGSDDRASVSVQAGDQLWLVVASVPDVFTGFETFAYDYRFVRS